MVYLSKVYLSNFILSTTCFFVSTMSRLLSLKFTCCHVPSSSSDLPGVVQQLCVALTVTTQMAQLASAHGATAASWRGGISPPLLLPPTSFFALSQRLSLPVTVSCHLPPLSPPLCPAVCLRARSSNGSVRCPDAANQPSKENSPGILKAAF